MPSPMTAFTVGATTAPFQIVHEGEWLPLWDQASNYAVVPIPGSDHVVTFLMGSGPLTVTWAVECDTAAEYALLTGLLQTVGVLRMPTVVAERMGVERIFFGAIYTEIPEVTLLALSSPQIALNGCITVQATFQRDGRDDE